VFVEKLCIIRSDVFEAYTALRHATFVQRRPPAPAPPKEARFSSGRNAATLLAFVETRRHSLKTGRFHIPQCNHAVAVLAADPTTSFDSQEVDFGSCIDGPLSPRAFWCFGNRIRCGDVTAFWRGALTAGPEGYVAGFQIIPTILARDTAWALTAAYPLIASVPIECR
jgi:hypothetical protein